MEQISVGVRDLKTQLSKYLHHVKAGETVIITEHGRPIGRIVPEPESIEDRLRQLVANGEIFWNGQRLSDIDPAGANKSDTLLSDIVSDLRE